mmetsp:Transcript_4741/g.12166  ORF Transcript_4741/g.12166 Transcript_4741/m.12166 type:complete len:339 (+) Transcript_4741:113-1129(+)
MRRSGCPPQTRHSLPVAGKRRLVLPFPFFLASHGDSSVDVEGVPGDVIGGRIQRQVFAHSRNLRWLSQSLQWDALRDLLEVFLVELFGHVGFDESRTDGVDGDAPGGELLGVRHGHRDDSSLGGGVVGLPGVSDLPDDRGDVDDAAGALLHGELEEGLRAVEDAAEVDVDDGLPRVGLHSHDEAVAGDSGVVDQYVDGSEGLDGFGEELLDRVGIGGIGLDGNGVTAGGLDLGDGRFGGILGSVGDVVDDDLVSLGSDVGRDRFSQTARGSGHQDHLGVIGHHVESAGGIGLGNSEARGCVLRNESARCRHDEGGGERDERAGGELHGCLCFLVFWLL